MDAETLQFYNFEGGGWPPSCICGAHCGSIHRVLGGLFHVQDLVWISPVVLIVQKFVYFVHLAWKWLFNHQNGGLGSIWPTKNGQLFQFWWNSVPGGFWGWNITQNFYLYLFLSRLLTIFLCLMAQIMRTLARVCLFWLSFILQPI